MVGSNATAHAQRLYDARALVEALIARLVESGDDAGQRLAQLALERIVQTADELVN